VNDPYRYPVLFFPVPALHQIKNQQAVQTEKEKTKTKILMIAPHQM
jgi:hypothetical protein